MTFGVFMKTETLVSYLVKLFGITNPQNKRLLLSGKKQLVVWT